MPSALDIRAEVEGLEELQKEMDRITRDLSGPPMFEALRAGTMLVTNDARKFSPLDTGRLQASIIPEVRTRGKTVQGVVGSNVEYAPYQEFGTWPIKPSGRGPRYLRRAVDKNREKIFALINKAVKRIIR